MQIVVEDWNLSAAERELVIAALADTGSIVEAAKLLGVTRHAVKRRIIKHNIPWPRSSIEPTREAVVLVQSGQLERPAESGISHVNRVERKFSCSWFANLVPNHVWQEETGDALEAIAAMEKAGCSAMEIRLKVWSTILRALVNGLREIIADLLSSRRTPPK